MMQQVDSGGQILSYHHHVGGNKEKGHGQDPRAEEQRRKVELGNLSQHQEEIKCLHQNVRIAMP